MPTTFKTILMGIGVSVAAFFGMPEDAKAYGGDYCREYTRTVSIGNRTQEAYGTACLQPDGSWMIVGEGLGRDIPDDVTSVDYIIRDDTRIVHPQRVVYYDTRYVTQRTRPSFVWSNGGHYYGDRYVSYTKPRYYHRHDNRNSHRWDDRRDRDRRDDRHRDRRERSGNDDRRDNYLGRGHRHDRD